MSIRQSRGEIASECFVYICDNGQNVGDLLEEIVSLSAQRNSPSAFLTEVYYFFLVVLYSRPCLLSENLTRLVMKSCMFRLEMENDSLENEGLIEQ